MKRSEPNQVLEVSRRAFLYTTGLAAAGAPLMFMGCGDNQLSDDGSPALAVQENDSRKRANVRAVFVYPPSKTFADNPKGWWSWPGREFDAEGRQVQYAAELKKIQERLGMTISVDGKPVANTTDARRIAGEITKDKPDGLLIVMFYNRSLNHVDLLLKAAEAAGVPAVFYITLGVKHGSVAKYRREGLYFIQSLDNFEAIEYGMRMINTKTLLSRSRLLSITNTRGVSEKTESFLGINVRTVPSAKYAEVFRKIKIDGEARKLIQSFTRGAKAVRVSREALENAARAHLTLQKMISEHDAHGVTMTCLRAGMLKPCMSFATLNGQLFPAACENDIGAAYSLFLGEALTGRAGFQHNPAFETERNHYYGSHCTCAPKLHGPDGEVSRHILRKFFHSNEGSCAVQTFWKADEPVTIIHYYTGQPPALDIYSGKVYKSHKMPPAGGCTTNVEIELTDRKDACEVKGHHNILFCGDFARRFRLFANLYKMKLV
ncbi:MAG: hypothetical protein QGH60_18370 [Phycisphaerae bacterium]|jgi:hypothetical protein|nr:hypothetical protein [Phycisphaerae bacterium]